MESCDSISTDETSSSSFSSAKSINYLSSSSSSKPTESSSSLLSISPKPTITKTTSNKRKTKLNLINEAEKIVTNTIICTIFSGPDHLTIDCKFRKKRNSTHTELNPDGSLTINGNRQKQQKLYCEYQSLMNELMDNKKYK
ncbi:unnamed protein product [Rotaria sp. Silwood2]|nr:unnamed protein product [Rotaria sp. Silwood2]